MTKCAFILAGRLKVFVHPGKVQGIVLYSEGNFFRPGEKGVTGVSIPPRPSSEKSSLACSESLASASSSSIGEEG